VTATATAPAEIRKSSPWWTQLWIWVLIAMALGIALGVWAPDTAAKMGPLGDAFIKLIRMLIAPIIFCTVVTGIAHMADMARVGRVAIKAIVYFEVMTTVALIIGLVAVNILKPGVGMNIDVSTLDAHAVDPYVKLTHEVGAVPFLMNIIPNSFVSAFTDGNILQVLFIAILSGLALVWIGERAKPLVDIIEIVAKMVFVIVGIIMWTAPFGAFGAIAFTVGKFGIGSLASLGELLLGFYATCIIFIAIGLGPVARLCGFSFSSSSATSRKSF
jgi:aerobic C4-dicarboxylate transport protein